MNQQTKKKATATTKTVAGNAKSATLKLVGDLLELNRIVEDLDSSFRAVTAGLKRDLVEVFKIALRAQQLKRKKKR